VEGFALVLAYTIYADFTGTVVVCLPVQIRLRYLAALRKKLRGFESASELYRSSDRRRSAKLVPTLADGRGQRNESLRS
jgi:hypothetical protein